jgi:hypothetical protein
LPWEFIYDSSLGRFLAQSDYTPVVRYLEMPERIRPLSVMPPLRILVIASSPDDPEYVPLDIDLEKARLQQSLDPLVQQGRVLLDWLEPPTLAELQERLSSSTYHVIHFIGHGGFDNRSGEGFLVLEDARQRAVQAPSYRIGPLLHDHRQLRLAVLNSCEGARNSRDDPFAGIATSLIRQGIPAVIAMQFEITDVAAVTFAGGFYTALASGYPVDAAVAQARKAILIQPNDIEWGTPVLYMRSPDGVVFDLSAAPIAPPPPTPAPAPWPEPPPAAPPSAPPPAAPVELALRQSTSTPGEYELTVRNPGSRPAEVRLDAFDERGKLYFSLPPQVTVRAGGAERVRLGVGSRGFHLTRKRRPFSVIASNEDGGDDSDVKVDGEFEEGPQRWLGLAGIGIIAPIILGLALAFGLPGAFAGGGSNEEARVQTPTAIPTSVSTARPGLTPTTVRPPIVATPVANQVVVVDENRMNCDQIRGTAYRSDAEQDWYRENCVANQATQNNNAPPRQQNTGNQNTENQNTQTVTAPVIKTMGCTSPRTPGGSDFEIRADPGDTIRCSPVVEGTVTTFKWGWAGSVDILTPTLTHTAQSVGQNAVGYTIRLTVEGPAGLATRTVFVRVK